MTLKDSVVVAHIHHELDVPMAVPLSCRKKQSPHWNRLFFIMILIASNTASTGNSRGRRP